MPTPHASSRPSAWSPPDGPNSQQQPAGVHWDAVRAPAHLAKPALDLIRDTTGQVIRDPYRGELVWLIPAGAAAEWEQLPNVETYGPACWVEIPPQGRQGGPGPHWLPLVGTSYLTPAPALHSALAVIIAQKYPTDAAERLC